MKRSIWAMVFSLVVGLVFSAGGCSSQNQSSAPSTASPAVTSPGASGAPGAEGAPGASGAQGASGVSGVSGAQGAPGASGAQGTSGVSGAQGAPGASGAPGAQGASGASGAPGAQGAPGASGGQMPSIEQKAGDYTVKLSMFPTPPVSTRDASLAITVLDSSGSMAKDAQLSKISLSMDSMDMGKNEPTFTPGSVAGSYNAQATFGMAGKWTVSVTISAGGKTETAKFPVNVQ